MLRNPTADMRYPTYSPRPNSDSKGVLVELDYVKGVPVITAVLVVRFVKTVSMRSYSLALQFVPDGVRFISHLDGYFQSLWIDVENPHARIVVFQRRRNRIQLPAQTTCIVSSVKGIGIRGRILEGFSSASESQT